MALIDKASLLMVPSVYEDGTLYNVLPSGNKAPDETGNHNGYDQTRADFTFSRGSNLAATRVNANGLIEKGRENLLTYSNDFSQWSNSGTSETSGQADKDGGTDAWLLTKSTADGYIYQDVSQSGVQTYSVYLKANALNWARVQLNGSGADKYAYFDLANGVIGGSGSGNIDENIESVGNGWYRCSIVADTTSTRVRIYPADGDNDVSGTSGSIYIQDAQLEQGLVATPYIETGATTATAGVLENTPRIDYSSGAGALLLESQRTNLYTHSEYSGAWNKTNWTTTDNYAISPEGVKNAFRAVSLNTSGILYVSGTGVTGQKNTLSVWAKSNTGSDQKFRFFTDGNTNTSSDFTATTEWQRFEYTYDCAFVTAGIKGASTELSDILFYGFQHEASSHVSSYVPTYGSAATRGADSCSVTGASDVIGQTEGTLYYDWIMNHESPNTSEDLYTLTLSDGSGNKMIAVNNYNNILAVFIIDTTTQFSDNSYTGGADGARIKLALAYANNDIALYINGTQIATDSSATIPTLNQVRLNSFWSGGAQDNTSVKQLALFNERLSNTELATLTTL